MEIGNQIKNLRMRRGITQEAMAKHFGITPQAISNICLLFIGEIQL